MLLSKATKKRATRRLPVVAELEVVLERLRTWYMSRVGFVVRVGVSITDEATPGTT